MWKRLILWHLALAAAVATGVFSFWMANAFDIPEALRAGELTMQLGVGALGLALIIAAGFDVVRLTVRAAVRVPTRR